MTKRKIDPRDVEIASLRADLDANTRLIAELLRDIERLEAEATERRKPCPSCGAQGVSSAELAAPRVGEPIETMRVECPDCHRTMSYAEYKTHKAQHAAAEEWTHHVGIASVRRSDLTGEAP